MAFLDYVLDVPHYGYERDGKLFVPTRKAIFKEFFSRMNFLRNRKNWLPFFSWITTLSFAIPLGIFFYKYFSIPLFLVGFFYSMFVLGTHGTVWYHRYGTHRAYKFSNAFWRFIVKNAVVKIIPDEVYIVSHYVHHLKSERPGDPYNVHAGWLYCFLADANHQGINKKLNPADYKKVLAMLDHTGIRMNSYEQYLKWGSVCHPFYTAMHFALNWAFWYGVFYLIGGHALATVIFGSCGVWGIGVRTFNYDGHGGGKDKRREGIDFNREDLSINQKWPGLVTGEWHNNHHLYPNGARAGFQPYQLDYAWWVIRGLFAVGGVSSYRDYTKDFYEKYYLPYLESKKKRVEPRELVSNPA